MKEDIEKQNVAVKRNSYLLFSQGGLNKKEIQLIFRKIFSFLILMNSVYSPNDS